MAKKTTTIVVLIGVLLLIGVSTYFFSGRFSIFSPDIIKSGSGIPASNLEIKNQVVNFDLGENSVDYSFDLKGSVSSYTDSFYIYSTGAFYTIFIDNESRSSGSDWHQLTRYNTNLDETWKISGSEDVSTLSPGKHLLRVVAATLPKDLWTIQDAYNNKCGYFGVASNPLTNCYKINDLMMSCNYAPVVGTGLYLYSGDWKSDLKQKTFCEEYHGTVYDVCNVAYSNDAKCSVNETWVETVYIGSVTIWSWQLYTCNAQKCIITGNCLGGTTTLANGQTFQNDGCQRSSDKYNDETKYRYNSCTLQEQCNPHMGKLTTQNPNTKLFTIVELKKDFVVCKDKLCAVATSQEEYDELLARINSLETDISTKVELIKQLTTKAEEFGAIINDLDLTISQMRDLIIQLTTKSEEQGQIVDDLKLNIIQKGELIKLLSTENEKQGQMLAQLELNLVEKVALVNQLTVKNKEQGVLIKAMKLSFSEQGEIVDALGKEIDDDAVIISSLTSSTDEQGKIMASMKLTIDEQSKLIKLLTSNNEEMADIIVNMKLTSDKEKELIAKLMPNLEEQQKLLDLILSRKSKGINTSLFIYFIGIGAVLVAIVGITIWVKLIK